MGNWGFGPLTRDANQQFLAALEMVSRFFELTHTRPDFGITEVSTGNQGRARARRRWRWTLPFGKLLHFVKDIDRAAARGADRGALTPGHFSTLLCTVDAAVTGGHDVLRLRLDGAMRR